MTFSQASAYSLSHIHEACSAVHPARAAELRSA